MVHTINFFEFKNDLCEDAIIFKNEAMRRVKTTIERKGAVDSGNRIRIIGHKNFFNEPEFKGFPTEMVTFPGNSITKIDGNEYTNSFNAFVHGPQIDYEDLEFNQISLSMQIELCTNEKFGHLLIFGDNEYLAIRDIVDQAKSQKNEKKLSWSVLVAPYHCSKTVMYLAEDGNEVRMQDILNDLDSFQRGDGIIVSSSEMIPKMNEFGDSPPHAIAKQAYEEVANGGFLCTHENENSGKPLIFNVSKHGFIYSGLTSSMKTKRTCQML